MFRHSTLLWIIIIIAGLNISTSVNTQQQSLCESLNDIDNVRNDLDEKSRRVRALCDAIHTSPGVSELNELDALPDFDLNQIESDHDANQILKRFRRARFSSGSRSSSSFSRSSSSGSRFSSSGSSSGSRIFSRSGSSSGGGRFFSRSGSSSSGSSSGGSRFFSRSGSSSSGSRIFSRSGGASSSSGTSGGHRAREAVRSMFRGSSRSKPSGLPSASGGLAGGGGGSKPSIGDKFRQITAGTGGSGGSRFSSGIGGSRFGGGGTSGSGFGGGGISGSGGNSWVRGGKKFLPVAIRFGKRYYQRRKYNKGIYAAAGAGAGYYAGSRMGGHHYPGSGAHYGQRYPNDNYGYPPEMDEPPKEIDGKSPTVFYCIQEDLNATLVNATLNEAGMGVCNISGSLVVCPVEIECKMSEADNCCEDDNGLPQCCGGPIPEEYATQYGGYGDDWDDGADSFNKVLNMITALSLVLATVCFTIWHHQEH